MANQKPKNKLGGLIAAGGVEQRFGVPESTLRGARIRGEVEYSTLSCGTIVYEVADIRKWISLRRDQANHTPGRKPAWLKKPSRKSK